MAPLQHISGKRTLRYVSKVDEMIIIKETYASGTTDDP